MQPTHCTSDMPWALQRLGTQRLPGAYAWRTLLDTGVNIPGGSDAPVESISPMLGIYAAVTRQDLTGHPPDGWAAEQRMTRSEAVRAFTIWAAEAAFAEEDLGTLEVGKWLDLSVFDRDVMLVPVSELPGAQVTATIVGGKVVYRAP